MSGGVFITYLTILGQKSDIRKERKTKKTFTPFLASLSLPYFLLLKLIDFYGKCLVFQICLSNLMVYLVKNL